MVDNTVSSEWWKTIIHHFLRVGDRFELRCWKEETKEILQGKRYGEAKEDGNEISIKGVLVDELLLELMEENPTDREIYNKMTKYFTINVKNELCDICSTHYGTEMYIAVILKSWHPFCCYNIINYSDSAWTSFHLSVYLIQ